MDEEGRFILFGISILGIGVFVFMATLVLIFRKRSISLYRRSALYALIASVIGGLLGLLYWHIFGYEPFRPFVTFSIPVLIMAPAFLVALYLGLLLISPHRR